jgi:hypothetical protein
MVEQFLFKMVQMFFTENSNGHQSIPTPNVNLMSKLLNQNVQAIAEVCGVDEEFVMFCSAKKDEPAYATRQLIENYDSVCQWISNYFLRG